jgi:hypothetical protein
MSLLTRWHNNTSGNYKTNTRTQIQHKNNSNTQKTKEERKTNNNNKRGDVISTHAITPLGYVSGVEVLLK